MTRLPDRRDVLAGAGSLAAMTLLPYPTFASTGTATPLNAVQSFLKTLSSDNLSKTRFNFGGDTHRFWNFMGTSLKPGFPIENMSKEQKDAADILLRSLLSRSGYDKMRLVMETQDIMRELGRGSRARNSERFSIAVFGEPQDNKAWGLRIEGHHLSLNWTFKGNEIVAITPSSFSIIPQNIPIGPRKGTLVLDAEETMARRLMSDLTGNKKERAYIAERPPGNVLALAGREERFKEKQGIAAADLSSAQLDLLWELVETTAVKPWPKTVSEKQVQRIREGDKASVHFAWAGGLKRGEMFYYRIHGDTFTLELTSVFGDSEHLHATFHDPERTFGKHVL